MRYLSELGSRALLLIAVYLGVTSGVNLRRSEASEGVRHGREVLSGTTLCSNFTGFYEPVYYCWLVDPCVDGLDEAPRFRYSEACTGGDMHCTALPAEFAQCTEWTVEDGVQPCSDYGPLATCCKYRNCGEGQECVDLVPGAAYCRMTPVPSLTTVPSPSPPISVTPPTVPSPAPLTPVLPAPVQLTPTVVPAPVAVTTPVSPPPVSVTVPSPVESIPSPESMAATRPSSWPPIRLMPPHAPLPPPPPPPPVLPAPTPVTRQPSPIALPPPTLPPPSPTPITLPTAVPTQLPPVATTVPPTPDVPPDVRIPSTTPASTAPVSQPSELFPFSPVLPVKAPQPSSPSPPSTPSESVTLPVPEEAEAQPRDVVPQTVVPAVPAPAAAVEGSRGAKQPTWTTVGVLLVFGAGLLFVAVMLERRSNSDDAVDENDYEMAIDEGYWTALSSPGQYGRTGVFNSGSFSKTRGKKTLYQ